MDNKEKIKKVSEYIEKNNFDCSIDFIKKIEEENIELKYDNDMILINKIYTLILMKIFYLDLIEAKTIAYHMSSDLCIEDFYMKEKNDNNSILISIRNDILNEYQKYINMELFGEVDVNEKND